MLDTLPTASNVLYASVEQVLSKGDAPATQYLLASTADRRLNMVTWSSNAFEIACSHTHLQDSPVLSYTMIRSRYLVLSSMSGRIVLYDCVNDEILQERRDHTKYVVRVTSLQDADGAFVLTAGWDASVRLYRMTFSDDDKPTLGEAVAIVTLPTNPQSVLFVEHPDSRTPIIVLSRRDSTFLYYYSIPTLTAGHGASTPAELQLLGKQNLAPHSNAWIAFTPSAIALCPNNPYLVAVATSAMPHMKLIIVRLLFPTISTTQSTGLVGVPGMSDAHANPPSISVAHDAPTLTQASQARAALAIQNRESAAIQIHCTTMAPQTPYSTPALAWRPDGSGVWVNSDDGVIRGIEVSTGKVVASLQGHEPGSKVRCLWSGWVDVGDPASREEWLVSGGFDQRLIVWRTC